MTSEGGCRFACNAQVPSVEKGILAQNMLRIKVQKTEATCIKQKRHLHLARKPLVFCKKATCV
jgi:hypothetical protein